MTDIEINAKEELESIINELIISKIDHKLHDLMGLLSAEFNDRSNGITSKIDTVSRNIDERNKEIIDKIEEDIENKLGDFISESEDWNREIKEITNNGIESIQQKLSDIQNKSLAEILSSALTIVENQEIYSKDFLLNLETVIKSSTAKVLSDNSDNREIVKTSQAELQADIVTLININGLDQKTNIQALDRSISNFVVIGKENNRDIQKHLETKFQTVEQLNSVLKNDFDEKLKLLKTENENQVSLVIRKTNIGFIGLLIINVLILLILLRELIV